MMGKYFVYYGFDYLPPRTLGKRCVERMVYELFSENSGVCRFHRKWVEAIIDEIISAHYKFPIEYKAHQFEIARQIYEADGDQSPFGKASGRLKSSGNTWKSGIVWVSKILICLPGSSAFAQIIEKLLKPIG